MRGGGANGGMAERGWATWAWLKGGGVERGRGWKGAEPIGRGLKRGRGLKEVWLRRGRGWRRWWRSGAWLKGGGA